VSWEAAAACAGESTVTFFPRFAVGMGAPAKNAAMTANAKAVCNRCPVSGECLAFALEDDIEHGIWGGMTPMERSKIRRAAGPALAGQLLRLRGA
jgi:WhiB family redox-sensing transcriptional regulator